MGLTKYTVRRILTGFITIIVTLGALYFIFRLPMYVTGTSPAQLYGFRIIRQQTEDISKQEAQAIIKNIRKTMGIPPEGASLGVRLKFFGRYMYRMITFQFGKEGLPPNRPIVPLLLARLPYTLTMLGPTILIEILLGLTLGVSAGKSVDQPKDKAITLFSLSTYSLPFYWIEMILIFLFVFQFNIWPATLGPTPTFQFREPFFRSLSVLFMMVLPIAGLTISGFGSWVYLMRNSLADVITEDYIFTARAKGLDETTIVYKHALRNAILPMWTNIVLSIATLWGGAVITETIFSIPGVGRFFYNSMLPPTDYPVVQMVFFFIALSVIGANIVADITYGILDPRVAYD